MTTTMETNMSDKPTLPPYQPMHVRLVGHRSLGVVRARWLGCLLELDDRTVYGPSAVFEVRPAEEPKPVQAPTSKPDPIVWVSGQDVSRAWTEKLMQGQPESEATAAPDPVLKERDRCLALVEGMRPRVTGADSVRAAVNAEIRHTLSVLAANIRDGSDPDPDDIPF